MLRYILRRLILMLPTLLLSVLLAFVLSEAAPGDPAESILNSDRGKEVQHYSPELRAEAYKSLRHKFGLDLPVFYFSVSSLAEPDTLYKVLQSKDRKVLARLTSSYGDWNEIAQYFSSLQKLENDRYKLQGTIPADSLIAFDETINLLHSEYNTEQIYNQAGNFPEGIAPLKEDIDKLKSDIKNVELHEHLWMTYIPTFHWHGFHNRFNLWIWNLLKGDFGESYSERRPVASVLKEAIPWTLLLNGIAILLAFLISIPIGISAASHRNSFYDRAMSVLLFVLYSLPVFWIATLLILFLGGGDFLIIFPASGLTDLAPDAPFLQKLPDIAWHLILPVFCLLYGSFAFISRQMRSAMIVALQQDYIRTAEAKGLDRGVIIKKHAFRNALLPMISLLAAVLPALINGSVIVESIFSIPGMGQKSFAAVESQDYPVVFGALVLATVLTMLGNLAADVMYAASDPRISFDPGSKNG